MRGQTEPRPVRLRQHAGATAAALDRNRGALKALITDFHVTARGFAREEANLERRRRRAAAHAARRACRRSPRSTSRSRRCARSLVELRPGRAELGAGARRRDAAGARAARPRRPRPSCAAWPTTSRAAGARPRRLIERSVPLYRQVRRGRELPERGARAVDRRTRCPTSSFPAEGKVYEEAPKPLPGLSGESRSGDANGQWFRVLAAGGKNLVDLQARRLRGPRRSRSSAPTRPSPSAARRSTPTCRARPSRRRTCARCPARRRQQRDASTPARRPPARYAKARRDAIELARGPAQGRGPRRQDLRRARRPHATTSAAGQRSRRSSDEAGAGDARDPQARQGGRSPCSA